MKRRLLSSSHSEEPADVRPTMLGIVTLLFLLLFFLLSTSTGQRLGVHTLKVSSTADLALLPHTGLLKKVTISIREGSTQVDFEVQSTDIAAAATSVERRQVLIPAAADGKVDLVLLDATMAQIHGMDPAQENASLAPDDRTSMDQLFRAMDIIKGPPATPYFPKLTLADG